MRQDRQEKCAQSVITLAGYTPINNTDNMGNIREFVPLSMRIVTYSECNFQAQCVVEMTCHAHYMSGAQVSPLSTAADDRGYYLLAKKPVRSDQYVYNMTPCDHPPMEVRPREPIFPPTDGKDCREFTFRMTTCPRYATYSCLFLAIELPIRAHSQLTLTITRYASEGIEGVEGSIPCSINAWTLCRCSFKFAYRPIEVIQERGTSAFEN